MTTYAEPPKGFAVRTLRDKTTGKTFDLLVPENATPQELQQHAAAYLEGGRRLFDLPPQAPPGYQEEGIGLGQSFQAGRYADNPEEMRAALGGQIAKMPDGALYWRKDDADTWKAINKPGFNLNDLSRFVGRYGAQTAGSLGMAAMTGGTSIPGQIAAAALGGVVGKGLDETAQSLMGTQRDNPNVAAGKVLTAGVEEGLGAGVGALVPGATNFLRGSREDVANAAIRELEQAQRFRTENPGFPPLMRADVLSTTGQTPGIIPNVAPPMGRAAVGQIERMAGRIGAERANRLDQAAAALEAGPYVMPPQRRADVSQAITGVAEQEQARLAAQTHRLGPSAEAGATLGREATRAGVEAEQNLVTRKYNDVHQAIRDEGLAFDMAPAQQALSLPGLKVTEQVPTGLLDANGNPIMRSAIRWVNASTDSAQRAQRVVAVIRSADRYQEDFEAIKGLRSILGEIAADPAYRTFKEGPAAEAYGRLSDVMRNPVNRGTLNPAPMNGSYLPALDAAEAAAKFKASLLENKQVRALIDAERNPALVQQFAADPQVMLDADVRHLLSQAPAAQRERFMDSVRREMAASPNPRAATDELPWAGNRDLENMLFPNQATRQAFDAQAAANKAFRESPLGQAFAQRDTELAPYRLLVEQTRSREDLTNFLGAASPQDLALFQNAVIDKAVKGSQKIDKNNVTVVDHRALMGQIKGLRESGMWDVLTADQQRNVRNMASYYRMMAAATGDVGSALETAGTISALRGLVAPWNASMRKRAIDALHDVAINRFLSSRLAKDANIDAVLAKLQRPPIDLRQGSVPGMVGAPVLFNRAPEEQSPPGG